MGHQSSKSNYSKKIEIFETETLIKDDDTNPFQNILNYEESFKKIEKAHQKQKQEKEIKRRQQLEILENKIVTEIQKQITSDEIDKTIEYYYFSGDLVLKIDYDYNCNHESKGIDILIGKLNIHLFKKGWKIDKWDIHHSMDTKEKTKIYIDLIKNK